MIARTVARGTDFIRVGAVGIRIWKTLRRFPNSWAGGKTFPRVISRRKNLALVRIVKFSRCPYIVKDFSYQERD